MSDTHLRKSERLNSTKALNALFAQGNSVKAYPLRFLWMHNDAPGNFPVQIVFPVSRRTWSRAVDRNLIRRRMREAYRLHKEILYTPCKMQRISISVACMYTAGSLHTFHEIESAMQKGMKSLAMACAKPLPK